MVRGSGHLPSAAVERQTPLSRERYVPHKRHVSRERHVRHRRQEAGRQNDHTNKRKQQNARFIRAFYHFIVRFRQIRSNGGKHTVIASFDDQGDECGHRDRDPARETRSARLREEDERSARRRIMTQSSSQHRDEGHGKHAALSEAQCEAVGAHLRHSAPRPCRAQCGRRRSRPPANRRTSLSRTPPACRPGARLLPSRNR